VDSLKLLSTPLVQDFAIPSWARNITAPGQRLFMTVFKTIFARSEEVGQELLLMLVKMITFTPMENTFPIV
jgi:hypothetical protein